jgi:hypothetical protein
VHSLSTDRNVKLNCKIFEDSPIATKIRCGRTKTESLVENLQRQWSIEIVLEQMGVNGYYRRFFIRFLLMFQTRGHAECFPWSSHSLIKTTQCRKNLSISMKMIMRIHWLFSMLFSINAISKTLDCLSRRQRWCQIRAVQFSFPKIVRTRSRHCQKQLQLPCYT